MRNPEERVDDVEKLLAEGKVFEERKKALIADLLKQKEAAIESFDDKLAKLGYHASGNSAKRRSHHKKAEPAAKSKEAK